MDRKLCTACKKEGEEARKKGEGCPPGKRKAVRMEMKVRLQLSNRDSEPRWVFSPESGFQTAGSGNPVQPCLKIKSKRGLGTGLNSPSHPNTDTHK